MQPLDGEEVIRRLAAIAHDDVELPVFKCRTCSDSGYVPGPTLRANGMNYSSVQACVDCELGAAVGRGYEIEDMKKRVGVAKAKAKLERDRRVLRELDRRARLGLPVGKDLDDSDEEEPPF